MIRVRLLSQVTAAGAALASLPTLMTGCATTTDGAQQGEMADTAISAGTGTLTLYNYAFQYKSTSTGGDEFIRVGERMTAAISFTDAMHLLDDPNNAVSAGDTDSLKLTLQITYRKFDDTTSQALYPVTFAPGTGGITTGTSAEFVVPEKTKGITLDYVAEFKDKDGTPQKKTILQQFGMAKELTVFGAFAPDKLALFDSLGTNYRVRVVEGGDVVAGHHLTLSYTDYRLDTQVDKTSLDLVYGKQKSYSRFGTIDVDAVGNLEYVVAAAISTDGGKTFNQIALNRDTNAEVFGGQAGGRYAFETSFEVPEGAGPNVQIAFHIQAFLDVPNYPSGTIDNPKFSPGQRVLLKDIWDNAGGGNYVLPVGAE